MLESVQKNIFEEFGLEVTSGEVSLGRTYPIFGMVTKLINETPGCVIAEINHNIIAHINVQDSDKIATLKERCFETGIFVSKITQIDPKIEVECQTIIFGKRRDFNA